MADKWISVETEAKERDFRGLLKMHAAIVKGIGRRQKIPPYLYVDCYAGRGSLEYKGRRFDGSPLVARDVLTASGMPYEAVHFERDPEEAALLADALWVPVNLLDTPDADSSPIFTEACQAGLPRWLASAGNQRERYGLVYVDPIRDEIPHELLNEAAAFLPKVDLLSYVSATQYNRRRGSFGKLNSTRPLLSEHVNAVNKPVKLIRGPHRGDPWQFCFVLWTNWADFPEWESAGFYRVDSPRGQQILYWVADLTGEEQHALANTQLPFEAVP